MCVCVCVCARARARSYESYFSMIPFTFSYNADLRMCKRNPDQTNAFAMVRDSDHRVERTAESPEVHSLQIGLSENSAAGKIIKHRFYVSSYDERRSAFSAVFSLIGVTRRD